jgi:quercetin dioxygenase-like cupin family protein
MESISLTELAEQKLTAARQARSGRAAQNIHGGHDRRLHQTLLALVADQELAEHNSPGEATLHVLHGRVRLTTESDAWEGQAGDYVVIPPERHALFAVEDSVVLLTVARRESGD